MGYIGIERISNGVQLARISTRNMNNTHAFINNDRAVKNSVCFLLLMVSKKVYLKFPTHPANVETKRDLNHLLEVIKLCYVISILPEDSRYHQRTSHGND